MNSIPNRYSSRITQPRSQGASQAMLLGTGLSREDLEKAQVGIASMWYEGNTCNMHLNTLAAKVREGVVAAGMVGMRFNTIGVSDGISMGTEGMSYSLPSRDVIADSIETVMQAQWYDGLVAIPGCDKNMPGCLIAMGRLNRPALMVYGGTIRPGHLADGTTLDIVSAFQCYGEYVAGRIDDARRSEIVSHACPGAGACGGMYTANTMASAIEAMGMALPNSASIPAEHPEKQAECLRAGEAIKLLLEKDLKPRDIMTREAFENAMVVVMTVGGSTNAVLHLIAMARSVGVSVTPADFQKVSKRVPYLADLKPSGKFVQEDLHSIGGTSGLMKMLLDAGLLNGDCMTVTGQTLAENLASSKGLAEGQKIVRALSDPIKKTGHITILHGNLAPGSAVAKINHDLRNSLASAQLVSDGLAASEDPRVQRAAPRLKRALERAIELATATLDYGKAAPRAPVMQTVRLLGVLQGAAEEALVENGMGIEISVDETFVIRSDADHLHRISANLIRNAAEAMRQTGTPDPEIRIRIEAGALIFSDNGPGLPEKTQENLFRPFSGSGRMGGTGLGLVIAHELAQALGGSLTLASTGPEGTIFRLALPGLEA